MKKLSSLLLAGSFLLFLSSCLKDKEADNGRIGYQVDAQKIVELARPNSASTTTALALDFIPRDTTFAVLPVRISSSQPAPQDITVTLDTTVTSSYVASHPGITHFKFSGGSIASGLTVTIPKGSLESEPIMLKVKPSLFDPSAQYVIGFRIASVSDPAYAINANLGTHYILLGAKNFFDGHYSLAFTNYHPSSNPGYTGATTEVDLITTGATTCKIFWDLAGTFANPSILGGGFSYFGSQEPAYTIDPATNVVTVQNAFPGAATFYTMNPTHNSRYDPAARTINCRWGYGYVGGNFALGSSREWTQFFTYLGPR